jgi:alpha-tubulin suppressor-like RCC1 family protein
MGSNIFGQLGLGESDLTLKSSPHLIEELLDKKIVQISSGANYSIALGKYGQVFAWGDGTHGQLGTGKFKNEVAPVEMGIPKILGVSPRIKSVSAGYKHVGVVTDEGQLLMAGNNKEGQLGIGNNISSARLIVNNYLTEKIEEVACGTNHTLVLTHSGKLFGFGTNMKGQLGCTSRKSSNIPVPIMGFTENLRIIQLACSNYSGFLDDMGKLYLWGFGDKN